MRMASWSLVAAGSLPEASLPDAGATRSVVDFLEGLVREGDPAWWPGGRQAMISLLASARLAAIGAVAGRSTEVGGAPLSLQEAFVLHIFCAESPIFEQVNEAFGSSAHMQQWAPFITILLSAMSSLSAPKVDSVYLVHDQFDPETFSKGNTVCCSGITSAARRFCAVFPDDAAFAASTSGSEGAVVFCIKSRTGRVVSDSEVVLLPGTRLTVNRWLLRDWQALTHQKSRELSEEVEVEALQDVMKTERKALVVELEEICVE